MTTRISVRELDPSDGVDGQVPVISNGEFTLSDPAGAVNADANLTTLAVDKTITGTTLVDVGLSGVLASSGPSDRFVITVSLDIDGASTATLTVPLLIDGVEVTSRILVRASASTRRPSSKTYLVDGLAAGNHPWKIQANLTAVNGSYTIWAVHSQVVVSRYGPDAAAVDDIDGGTWDTIYSDFIDGGTF